MVLLTSRTGFQLERFLKCKVLSHTITTELFSAKHFMVNQTYVTLFCSHTFAGISQKVPSQFELQITTMKLMLKTKLVLGFSAFSDS